MEYAYAVVNPPALIYVYQLRITMIVHESIHNLNLFQQQLTN